MDRKHAVGSLAIVALLVGAVLRASYGDRSGPGNTSDANPSSSESAAVKHSAAGDDQVDTLDVIAESLGVDFSAEGLRTRARRCVDALRPPRDTDANSKSDHDWASAAAFLQAFFNLPLRASTSSLTMLRAAARRLATESRPASAPATSLTPESERALASIESFLAQYLDGDAPRMEHSRDEAKLLAEDFDRLDKTRLKLPALEHAASEQKIQMRFLIATLPDPIDSFTGWQFDPMLDGITQAVAESDYVLDRFHFPDTDRQHLRQGAAPAERGRSHETEPSLIIFRRRIDPPDPNDSPEPADAQNSASSATVPVHERLVLILVHENPSAGVHERALAAAVRLVAQWQDPDQPTWTDRYVRILGPTFSGSSYSIVRGLKQVGEDIRGHAKSVWIVSGSATDSANKKTLQDAAELRGLNVTFQATVQPDDRLLRVLMNHLVAQGWQGPMAVLSEANTQYGRQLRALFDINYGPVNQQPIADIEKKLLTCKTAPATIGDDECRAAERNKQRRDENEKVKDRFREVIHLPFPMNISRLRSMSQPDKAAVGDALGLPSRFRPLAMEQTEQAEDQIPQFFPKTAGSYLELALSGILQTIKREHVRTVALMATDPRDKLYLAQQIARGSSDVSIVTAENDSVYAHPDYSSYLQGALVASSYPLYSVNQRWTYGFQGNLERRHFANGSAQGMYNAALALLNYDSGGRPMPERVAQGVPSLLEYSSPTTDAGVARCLPDCQPPIWISAVGRGSAWPIRAYAVNATNGSVSDPMYVVRGQPGNVDPAPRLSLVTFPSQLFIALCLALTAATVLLWTGTAAEWPKSLTAPQPAAYFLLFVAMLIVSQTLLATVLVGRFRLEQTWWTTVALIAGMLTLVGLIDVARRGIERVRAALHVDSSEQPRVLRWSPFPIAVAVLWTTGNLMLYVAPAAISSPADAIGFLSRAMDFGSGVSPALPVIFLAATVGLWCATELRRLSKPAVVLVDQDVQRVIERSIAGTIETMRDHWNFFNRSIVAVPAPVAVVIALGLAAIAIFFFDPVVAPLVTIEGASFGRFVSTGLFAAYALIGAALVQFAYLWWRLRQLLTRMAWHSMVEAYQRVPPDLFPPAILPRVPRLMELQIAVTRWQRYASAVSPVSLLGSGIPAECLEIGGAFDQDMRRCPHQHWSTSRTWQLLVKAIGHGSYQPAPLGAFIPASLGPLLARSVAEGGGPNQPSANEHEEDLIAIAMAFVIREAVARLGYNLLFITGGVVLMFCSHTLFPFEAQHKLGALAWTYIGLTFTAVLTVLVQVQRNEIISRLASSSSAARTTWDTEFVLKLAIFWLLPLLTLFATQFPDVGGVILHWLQPMEHALP